MPFKGLGLNVRYKSPRCVFRINPELIHLSQNHRTFAVHHKEDMHEMLSMYQRTDRQQYHRVY